MSIDIEIDSIISNNSISNELCQRLESIRQCFDTNIALRSLYEKVYVDGGIMDRLYDNFHKLKKGNFSYPIFMQCWEDYFLSPHKIMFVGRDPYTWYLGNEYDNNVPCLVNWQGDFSLDNIINCYKDFNLGIGSSKRRGFVEFMRVANNYVNGPISHNYLYTNINKLGKRNGSGPCNVKKLSNVIRSLNNLLCKEIEITRPNSVFFLTEYNNKKNCDKSYIGLIKSLSGFENCTFDEVSGLDIQSDNSYSSIYSVGKFPIDGISLYVFPHPYEMSSSDIKTYAKVLKSLVK